MTWRSPEEQYGLYVLRRGRKLPRQLATGPDLDSIGCAFGTLLAEGEIRPTDRIGVLDSHGRDDGPGTWLVNPYEDGGKA